jgi:hypothetical protein
MIRILFSQGLRIMDLSDTPSFIPATRHDGWSPELKSRFLAALAEKGNVRAAAARCGRSAQSAYLQRRRDPWFARGWAGALIHAHEHSVQVLADRALDGVEEPVFYRGELVGTRRRYDNRLLLAHIARLDQLVACYEQARHDAGRFDELLAIVAGEEVPTTMAAGGDGFLPQDREAFVEATVAQAQLAVVTEHLESPTRFDHGAEEACDAALMSASEAARTAAEVEWDDWFARACARVDRLMQGTPEALVVTTPPRCAAGPEEALRTASIVSTSGLGPAVADLGDQRDAAVGIAERGYPGNAGRSHGVLGAGEPAFADPVEGEQR